MADLDGKVAIVTGAASYVGTAIGAALVAAGATVVLADRDEAHGAESAARLGDGARFVATDIAEDAHVDRLLAHVIEASGRLDIVVNAAAIFDDERLDTSRELWHRVLDVNLVSAAILWARRRPSRGQRGTGDTPLECAARGKHRTCASTARGVSCEHRSSPPSASSPSPSSWS